MKYRQMGRTGLMVSEICLGTMTFGSQLDEAGSIEVIDRALDSGVNFIDAADLYVEGLSDHPHR
jgi:aryl-alcohol dehydrogenase-like predicted oxidoreductase